MWELAVPVAIGVLVVLVIGLLLAKLYRRSTRDEAYVRTGLGGQKVVLDGGSLVLPVFHSTAAVNLKTLRLEVARGGPDSLITKDRMRVDIGAEFYVRVKPDASSIALAAQTLGSRTNNAGELRELIEAKFVDGLRSVAATMNLEELQEQRATFVKSVQDAVGADIQNNGLELESVSLTRLDQSDIKHFNPSNFFDAHGLTTLTKITREREQERNQIVRTTEVNIAQQDLVARQTTLTIESTKREAELARIQRIAGVGGLEIDFRDGVRNRRSPEYLLVHGLPPEAANETYEEWVSRIHPDDRERTVQHLFGILKSGNEDYSAEYRIVRPNDGTTRWIRVVAKIERDRSDGGDRARQADHGARAALAESSQRIVEMTIGVIRDGRDLVFLRWIRSDVSLGETDGADVERDELLRGLSPSDQLG